MKTLKESILDKDFDISDQDARGYFKKTRAKFNTGEWFSRENAEVVFYKGSEFTFNELLNWIYSDCKKQGPVGTIKLKTLQVLKKPVINIVTNKNGEIVIAVDYFDEEGPVRLQIHKKPEKLIKHWDYGESVYAYKQPKTKFGPVIGINGDEKVYVTNNSMVEHILGYFKD